MHCNTAHGHTCCLLSLPPQLLQQRPGLLKIGGLKALSEPAVDRRQERIYFGTLALLLSEAGQTGGLAQLQGFGLLAAGDVQGLVQTGLGLRLVRDGLAQQQLPLEPVHLRCIFMLPGVVHVHHRLGQQAQALLGLSCLPICLRQQDKLMRYCHPCSHGPPRCQGLTYLCCPLLGPPLRRQGPTPEHRPSGQPLRKPLSARERHGDLGPLLGRVGLPAVAMDVGNIELDGRRARGMGQLLG
jgi:hypothetical protein